MTKIPKNMANTNEDQGAKSFLVNYFTFYIISYGNIFRIYMLSCPSVNKGKNHADIHFLTKGNVLMINNFPVTTIVFDRFLD